ncbi:MAG: RHS repeat-associated core domain-containing protein [Pyrinomonadaceae bacterium]
MEYFLTDHLGSTNVLADHTGTITSSANYDSFGNPTGNLTTRYQYTGRELDADIGLYYYRARWYDSEIGRFISEDPIGFEGKDVNLFNYVYGNPIKFSDPTGLDGFGNDTADWLDERIEFARKYYEPDEQDWWTRGVNNTIADLARGFSDIFRLGSGIGCAFYSEKMTGWERTGAVVHDGLRGLAVAGAVGGGLSRVANAAKSGKPLLTGAEVASSSSNAGKPISNKELAEGIKEWLGKGARVDRKSGSDLKLVSENNERAIRFDLVKSHGDKPHVNVELWKKRNRCPGDKRMTNVRNDHVYPY